MTNISKSGILALAASSVFLAPVCAQNTGGAAEKPLTPAEKKFVLDSSNTNLLEVRLGQLAAQNAMSNDVKSFAQRMVDDHSKAEETLKQVARAHKMTLPPDLNAEGKKELDKLAALHGTAFDIAYISFNVPAHKATLEKMQKAEPKLTSPDLRAWNQQTMPTVEQHFKMAEATDRAIASEKMHMKTGGASSSY